MISSIGMKKILPTITWAVFCRARSSCQQAQSSTRLETEVTSVLLTADYVGQALPFLGVGLNRGQAADKALLLWTYRQPSAGREGTGGSASAADL